MQHTPMSQFWHDEWERILDQYPLTTRSLPLKQQVERWSKVARTCGVDLGMNSERVRDVMDLMTSLNLIDERSAILDIGCGSGAYSIPIAKRAGHVDALDFSTDMLELLKRRMQEDSVTNIRPIHEHFSNFAQYAKINGGLYDLVFASLNPGVYSGDSILEMTALSKKYCIYIAAKQIVTQSEIELDPLVLDEKSALIKGSNVIYPFNMLYHMGYEPQIYYTSYYSEREETCEVAFNRIKNDYKEKAPEKDGYEDKILSYIEDHLHKGVFTEKTSGTLGILLWHVTTPYVKVQSFLP